METMKYTNLAGSNMAVSGNGTHVDEVDSLFISSCWQNSNSSIQNDFIDTNKLMLDGGISNLGSDKLLLGSPISQEDEEIESKPSMDTLDNLLLGTNSLAELKPLPPFTGYTANLSINGIQGHHYHTISQRIPEENNNTYNSYNEHNIVSSSTCNVSADSACDSASKTMYGVDEVVKLGYGSCVNPDSVSSAIKFEDCNQTSADSVTHIKTEIAEYDISSIEDIAAIIGSAIADTTVPNNNNTENDHANDSRDSWMDLDAWIDGACVDQPKSLIITQDGLSEFVIPNTSNEFKNQQVEYSSKHQNQQGSSTLQTLLTHGYMPLLQNRLQNGPPVKQEASSSNYNTEMISTSSPPANVVSTTDNLLLTVNGRFMPQYSLHGINDDPLGQNYPHTTTTTPNAPKKSRSRAQKKQQQAATSTVFPSEQSLGLLGKEKPVHRCSICNRGFLNKSNIKVHLRTHTGEKPFRCDTCAKAFRQKAHLLKHQQIHKRIGRD
ncbi:ichor [Aethina tumida]|uniref:ichor n=1 Tax=Aethina tumida TaxID=116153 RepID=UPI00096B0E5C|nr:ichor [Aethina tumida]XP_049822541.1 ichor [Aethina tumida]XP_049822542.1 ichor [Aethina tumida]